MPNLVLAYSEQSDIARLQGIYIEQRSFSLFFAMITLSIQAFFLAEGKSWVVLVTSVLTASSNAVLAYALIFGEFGLPEMGIRGAALDVTDPEPISPSHPLCQLKNCLITPHIGSATVECRTLMTKIAAENLIRFFDDQS